MVRRGGRYPKSFNPPSEPVRGRNAHVASRASCNGETNGEACTPDTKVRVITLITCIARARDSHASGVERGSAE
jgi:hypothetical protein